MSAVCVCYWHSESVKHKGLQYSYSPCASFNPKYPVGGWVLMEVWDIKARRSLYESMCDMPVPKIPAAVTKAAKAKLAKVKKIEPWPGED